MHSRKRLRAGPFAGKTAVVGAMDRDTGQIVTEVVHRTDAPTLQAFVEDHTTDGAMVYADEAPAYDGLVRKHESIRHSAGEYLRD
jgi:hypothetical protein